MTRRRLRPDHSFAVGITQSVAQGSEPFDHGGATAQDLLEHNLCMLAGRTVEVLGSKPVQLGDVRSVSIGHTGLVQDVFAHRFEQGPGTGDGTLRVARAPLEGFGPRLLHVLRIKAPDLGTDQGVRGRALDPFQVREQWLKGIPQKAPALLVGVPLPLNGLPKLTQIAVGAHNGRQQRIERTALHKHRPQAPVFPIVLTPTGGMADQKVLQLLREL